MKKITFLFFLGILGMNAQTTHNLNWFAGIGSNVDLVINSGDTVKWTWTSPNHSVENDPSGTSVESFNSGVLVPNGSTFSHTFTVIGSNDYYCVVHGAGSMSGTITVQTLGIEDFQAEFDFKITPNPVDTEFDIDLPDAVENAIAEIYDVLGKQLLSTEISKLNSNIDVTNLNNGIYLVRVSSNSSSQTKRIVKQ